MLASEERPTIRRYSLQKISHEQEVPDALFNDFSSFFERSKDLSNLNLYPVLRKGLNGELNIHLITSTTDSRVIIWDTENIARTLLFPNGENAIYTKTQIRKDLSISYQKTLRKRHAKAKFLIGHDSITDMAVIHKPFDMVIIAESNGTVLVYK